MTNHHLQGGGDGARLRAVLPLLGTYPSGRTPVRKQSAATSNKENSCLGLIAGPIFLLGAALIAIAFGASDSTAWAIAAVAFVAFLVLGWGGLFIWALLSSNGTDNRQADDAIGRDSER
jgi:hypothetical protein